ncbi:MAG: glycosyltransferase family 4 protein [Clostridia bacterium]|nr:glycosyltransferase family 4 protein [Clostridia bacterium]
MRILIVSNKVKTYALGFQNAALPILQLGHEVVWAADFSKLSTDRGEIPYPIERISINTNPLNQDNRKAYKQLLDIIEKYKIDGVVCSTPIGGALARLAAKKKKISPVIYAAHGFLFFKGAPFINRTVYKWEEKILAHFTDALITITDEDYQAAQGLKLRSGRKPYLVHGAGVNIGVKVNVDKQQKRRELDIPEDAFVIVSAGELNKNKNTEVIIRALSEMKKQSVHYIACGVGPEEDNLRQLAEKLKVTGQFHLAGYRTDMPEILSIADAFTMMSFREGMPRAVLEAMDLGLPCVGSDTRGIRDLIDEEGGFICNPNDPCAFAAAFRKLMDDPEMRKQMGEHNRGKVQMYSSDVVKKELYEIYKEVFGVNEYCK